tara:strand:- start:745 stop:1497 length:753 start_codon:yes stop_codon:yes gene_type:complete
MKKDKVIIENFVKVFNKIKRLNESELNELDYEKVYANTNPWDKQQIKIDDYPAEGKNLDWTLKSADIALNSTNYQEKSEQRHRFLMDDSELQEYLNKLKKIKTALDKHAAGEQLEDFERKVVRYYKSNKREQKARISNTAGDKLDSNFIKNFDKSQFSEYENKAIEMFSREDRSKGEAFIMDINPEQYDDGIRFRVNCKFNGEDAEFLIYQDGSNGFVGNDDFRPYVVNDSNFRNLVSNIINKIRPQTNY